MLMKIYTWVIYKLNIKSLIAKDIVKNYSWTVNLMAYEIAITQSKDKCNEKVPPKELFKQNLVDVRQFLINNEQFQVSKYISENPKLLKLRRLFLESVDISSFTDVGALGSNKVKKIRLKEYIHNKDYIHRELKLTKNNFKLINEVWLDRHYYPSKDKIRISIDNWFGVVSSISILFLVGGYIYNRFFYFYFGIDVSKVFYISDYISSSVDLISVLLLSLALTAFGYIIPEYFNEKSDASNIISKESVDGFVSMHNKGKTNVLGYIVLTTLITMLILELLFIEIPFEIHLIPIAAGLLVLSESIPVHRLFHNPKLATLVYILTVWFVINIVARVVTDIKGLETGRNVKNNRLVLTEDYKYLESSKLLSNTTDYLILWSIEEQKVIIIPKEDSLISIESG